MSDTTMQRSSSSLSEDDVPIQQRRRSKGQSRAKPRKFDDKVGKDAGSKKFVIPRRKKAEDLFQNENFDTREGKDLSRTIAQSFYQTNLYSAYNYEKLTIVHNTPFQEQFSTKKQEMRQEGYTQKEMEDSYAYLFLDNWSKVKNISKQGLCTGSSTTSTLGDPKMGVSLSRFPDLVSPHLLTSRTSGYLMVFKVVKGKLKAVGERTSYDCAIEPTPNYDGHISKLFPPGHKVSMEQAYLSSQYYFYEFMEDGDDIHARRPRQCCPYAVVRFSVAVSNYQYKDMSTWNISELEPLMKTSDGRKYQDYAKHGRTLWSGVVKNKEKVLTKADLICYSEDELPFSIGEYIDIKAKAAYEKLEPLLPSPIFTQLPVISMRCKAVDNRIVYIYCEIRPQDNNTKLDKLITYFQDRHLAGVADFPDYNACIYVIPTSEFTHQLGLTDEHYPNMLHAVLMKQLPKEDIHSINKKTNVSNVDPVAEAAVIRDIRKELQQIQFQQIKKVADMSADLCTTTSSKMDTSENDNENTKDSEDVAIESQSTFSGYKSVHVGRDQDVFKSPPPVQTHPAVLDYPLMSRLSSVGTRTNEIIRHFKDPRLSPKSPVIINFSSAREVEMVSSDDSPKTSLSSVSPLITNRMPGSVTTQTSTSTSRNEGVTETRTVGTSSSSTTRSVSRLSSRLTALFSNLSSRSPATTADNGRKVSPSSITTVSSETPKTTSPVAISTTSLLSTASTQQSITASAFPTITTPPTPTLTIPQFTSEEDKAKEVLSSSRASGSSTVANDVSPFSLVTPSVHVTTANSVGSPSIVSNVVSSKHLPHTPSQSTSFSDVSRVVLTQPSSNVPTAPSSISVMPLSPLVSAVPSGMLSYSSVYTPKTGNDTSTSSTQQTLVQYPPIKCLRRGHVYSLSAATSPNGSSGNSSKQSVVCVADLMTRAVTTVNSPDQAPPVHSQVSSVTNDQSTKCGMVLDLPSSTALSSTFPVALPSTTSIDASSSSAIVIPPAAKRIPLHKPTGKPCATPNSSLAGKEKLSSKPIVSDVSPVFDTTTSSMTVPSQSSASTVAPLSKASKNTSPSIVTPPTAQRFPLHKSIVSAEKPCTTPNSTVADKTKPSPKPIVSDISPVFDITPSMTVHSQSSASTVALPSKASKNASPSIVTPPAAQRFPLHKSITSAEKPCAMPKNSVAGKTKPSQKPIVSDVSPVFDITPSMTVTSQSSVSTVAPLSKASKNVSPSIVNPPAAQRFPLHKSIASAEKPCTTSKNYVADKTKQSQKPIVSDVSPVFDITPSMIVPSQSSASTVALPSKASKNVSPSIITPPAIQRFPLHKLITSGEKPCATSKISVAGKTKPSQKPIASDVSPISNITPLSVPTLSSASPSAASKNASSSIATTAAVTRTSFKKSITPATKPCTMPRNSVAKPSPKPIISDVSPVSHTVSSIIVSKQNPINLKQVPEASCSNADYTTVTFTTLPETPFIASQIPQLAAYETMTSAVTSLKGDTYRISTEKSGKTLPERHHFDVEGDGLPTEEVVSAPTGNKDPEWKPLAASVSGKTALPAISSQGTTTGTKKKPSAKSSSAQADNPPQSLVAPTTIKNVSLVAPSHVTTLTEPLEDDESYSLQISSVSSVTAADSPTEQSRELEIWHSVFAQSSEPQQPSTSTTTITISTVTSSTGISKCEMLSKTGKNVAVFESCVDHVPPPPLPPPPPPPPSPPSTAPAGMLGEGRERSPKSNSAILSENKVCSTTTSFSNAEKFSEQALPIPTLTVSNMSPFSKYSPTGLRKITGESPYALPSTHTDISNTAYGNPQNTLTWFPVPSSIPVVLSQFSNETMLSASLQNNGWASQGASFGFPMTMPVRKGPTNTSPLTATSLAFIPGSGNPYPLTNTPPRNPALFTAVQPFIRTPPPCQLTLPKNTLPVQVAILEPLANHVINVVGSSKTTEDTKLSQIPCDLTTTSGFGYTMRYPDVFLNVPGDSKTATSNNARTGSPQKKGMVQTNTAGAESKRVASPLTKVGKHSSTIKDDAKQDNVYTLERSVKQGKKNDDEESVETTSGDERSVINEEEGTESEEENSEEPERPVLYTSEMSTPEHERTYSPISSPGSSDFEWARQDGLVVLDDIDLSELSTVSEYLNTTDEENSTLSVGSHVSELKRETPEVDGAKLVDVSRDDNSEDLVKAGGKENKSDARTRLHRHGSKVTSDKLKKSTGSISSPERSRSVHLDGSRPRRSTKRSTSRESSTLPKKEHSVDVQRLSSSRRDDDSRSKASKSRSRNEREKSDHRSSTKYSSSSHHNRSYRSRDRSRDRSSDRSPDKESRSRRKRRSRSSSTRRTSSRKARSRSNGSVSSNSNNEGVRRKKRRRRRSKSSSPRRKTTIDFSDEAVLLEITKPEMMERIQEFLREKLRRALKEAPDCLEDQASRPFFGGISELIYAQRPAPEAIVLQDPNCRSVLVKPMRKRPAVEVDGEGLKLAGELKNISPNCGSNRGTLVGDCDALDYTIRESLRKDSNLTKTVNNVDLIMREKYLSERIEDERTYYALNGFPEANKNVDESALGGDEFSHLHYKERSKAKSINRSYIRELNAKRQRCLLLKQLRNMRAREKVRSTEVTLAIQRNLNCEVCKTVMFSDKRGSKTDSVCSAVVPARGTLRINREMNNELAVKCVDDQAHLSKAGNQSDVNVVSMEISDGVDKEIESGEISIKASKENLKESNCHVDSVIFGAECSRYRNVDCVSAESCKETTSGTSAKKDCGGDALEEWVFKNLRDIRASNNHAIKNFSKSQRDDSLNLKKSRRESRKKTQAAKLSGKRGGEVPDKKVCKLDNQRRKHDVKKHTEHVLMRKSRVEGNGPYVDVDTESLGQVCAGRMTERRTSAAQKRKSESRKKANSDSINPCGKRHVKDHIRGRPTTESRTNRIRPRRCGKDCFNKQDKPERGSFFSCNISGPSEFDDILVESRSHFQLQIQIVTHKIWCKNFPVQSANTSLGLTAQDVPHSTGSNNGSEIAKSLADLDEKPGNTGSYEPSIVADQTKLDFQKAQSLCCVDEPSEVTPSGTPEAKQSPSYQASNGLSERENVLDDDTLKTRLSSVLKSLTKPQLNILFRSPR